MPKNKNDYSFPIADFSLSFTSNANAFRSSRPVIFSISTGSTADTETPPLVYYHITRQQQPDIGIGIQCLKSKSGVACSHNNVIGEIFINFLLQGRF